MIMSHNSVIEYLVIGLLMCGNLVCRVPIMGGAYECPVPQFGGLNLWARPVEGSICLRVDQSSDRVLGWETYSCFSSAARDICRSEASPRGTQVHSALGRRRGASNLWRGTGAVLREIGGDVALVHPHGLAGVSFDESLVLLWLILCFRFVRTAVTFGKKFVITPLVGSKVSHTLRRHFQFLSVFLRSTAPLHQNFVLHQSCNAPVALLRHVPPGHAHRISIVTSKDPKAPEVQDGSLMQNYV